MDIQKKIDQLYAELFQLQGYIRDYGKLCLPDELRYKDISLQLKELYKEKNKVSNP
jgi:hypothetical protein